MTLHVSQSSKRVLIAEDDNVTRHLLSAVVKSEGYDAVAVNDGREAYRILQSDGKFEAAIFDMKMPHLDGLEIIRYMRTEKRLMRIPVMMVTSERDLQLISNSFLAGVTVFLPKPFTADQLQTMVRMLLSRTSVSPASPPQLASLATPR